MQLVDNKTPVISIKRSKTNMSVEAPHYRDAGQKKSSNSSLLLMNPVASGDNMAVDLNSAQKFKEEIPLLVPCCEGKELQISEDLVRSGLSAISVKYDSLVHSISMSSANETTVPHSIVKHRNSFRCLHRPDLKRVPYLRRLTPDELEMLFRGFADIPYQLPKNENMKVKNLVETSSTPADLKNIALSVPPDGIQLHPIPETKSNAKDVPAGMRLHGTRARLYTSVLAGTKTGDQLLEDTPIEDEDIKMPENIAPEDEVQLNEELQIILPPKYDDIAP